VCVVIIIAVNCPIFDTDIENVHFHILLAPRQNAAKKWSEPSFTVANPGVLRMAGEFVWPSQVLFSMPFGARCSFSIFTCNMRILIIEGIFYQKL
jgi:hypothetical protein